MRVQLADAHQQPGVVPAHFVSCSRRPSSTVSVWMPTSSSLPPADPAGTRSSSLTVARFTPSGIDGRALRRVTPYDLTAGDGPDWSPDGSRILFRSPENDDFLNSNLFSIRTEGRGLRQLTSMPPTTKIYSASFSPDGTSITFGMTGVEGAADVFRMRLDGSAVTPVTRTPLWDSAPDWGGLK